MKSCSGKLISQICVYLCYFCHSCKCQELFFILSLSNTVNHFHCPSTRRNARILTKIIPFKNQRLHLQTRLRGHLESVEVGLSEKFVTSSSVTVYIMVIVIIKFSINIPCTPTCSALVTRYDTAVLYLDWFPQSQFRFCIILSISVSELARV